MKRRHIKGIWRLARLIWITSTLFWLIETGIFLIIEGWHIKATNEVEIYLDKRARGMWGIALWLTVYVLVWFLINLPKYLSKSKEQ